MAVNSFMQVNMHKADKELSEIAARWEEIKKGTSQVQQIYCVLYSLTQPLKAAA